MAEFDWFQRQDISESSKAQQPDDALEWAKQAYARLKAQQEAEKAADASAEPEPAAVPEPEPESAPETQPEVVSLAPHHGQCDDGRSEQRRAPR